MSEAKKRKKSYYKQAKKHCSGRQQLDAGMKGFLITVNRHEKEAVREAYNLLNEYKELLYGQTKSEAAPSPCEEIDFENLIATQVEETCGKTGSTEREFQAVETKANNCLFIRAATLEHPDEVVARLLSDIASGGNAKSRFILKMFPVFGTCRATEEKIEKLAEELMGQFCAGGRAVNTYAALYKARCNNLSRKRILSAVGRAVYHVSASSRVDLNNPEYVVSVDVLNKFACISIMKDFYALRKYNLQELAKSGFSSGKEDCADGVAAEAGPADENGGGANENKTGTALEYAADKRCSSPVSAGKDAALNVDSVDVQPCSSSTATENPAAQPDGVTCVAGAECEAQSGASEDKVDSVLVEGCS